MSGSIPAGALPWAVVLAVIGTAAIPAFQAAFALNPAERRLAAAAASEQSVPINGLSSVVAFVACKCLHPVKSGGIKDLFALPFQALTPELDLSDVWPVVLQNPGVSQYGSKRKLPPAP